MYHNWKISVSFSISRFSVKPEGIFSPLNSHTTFAQNREEDSGWEFLISIVSFGGVANRWAANVNHFLFIFFFLLAQVAFYLMARFEDYLQMQNISSVVSCSIFLTMHCDRRITFVHSHDRETLKHNECEQYEKKNQQPKFEFPSNKLNRQFRSRKGFWIFLSLFRFSLARLAWKRWNNAYNGHNNRSTR